MSCIRSCYDKDSSNFEHDDCKTCIHGDRPQQRTWVGLTTYEIGVCSTEAAMNNNPMVGGAVTFAEAIEAKLKEKNT